MVVSDTIFLMRMPTEPRKFWSRVVARGECWEWIGTTHLGYGVTSVVIDGRWRNRKAHRVAWQQTRGEIPAGLVLDHLCRNTRCVNPDHLEPVTLVENIRRGVGMGPRNAMKTHCKQGHEFTPENTRPRDGHPEWRLCRTCAKETSAKYYAKNRSPDTRPYRRKAPMA